MQKKKLTEMSPKKLLLIGLFYFIWPLDIPTFIDDIIVNIITCSLAGYVAIVQKKAMRLAQRGVARVAPVIGQKNADALIGAASEASSIAASAVTSAITHSSSARSGLAGGPLNTGGAKKLDSF